MTLRDAACWVDYCVHLCGVITHRWDRDSTLVAHEMNWTEWLVCFSMFVIDTYRILRTSQWFLIKLPTNKFLIVDYVCMIMFQDHQYVAEHFHIESFVLIYQISTCSEGSIEVWLYGDGHKDPDTLSRTISRDKESGWRPPVQIMATIHIYNDGSTWR